MAMQVIAIGTSLGGTAALQILLPMLPSDLGAAVVLVFHRAQGSDETLVKFLRKHCRLPVEEAQDKTPIHTRRLYFAPADYHLLVEGDHFALSTEAAVSFARPSIDVLFESVAEACAERAVGVVLSGAGHDGAAGLAAIKQRGGLTLVQSPASAQSSHMPDAAIATGKVDRILSVEEIVPFLTKWQHK
jgi:two-component system chemotaxis response regulator CheB